MRFVLKKLYNVNSRRVFTMKRKLVSLVLATAMVTSSMMARPVFASDDTAAEETAD